MSKRIAKKAAVRLLNPILSPFRPANVIMFHLGRSGSTVLGDMLLQNRRVMWGSELYDRTIFSHWRTAFNDRHTIGEIPKDPIAILQDDMRGALNRAYGIELKPFHFRLIHIDFKRYLAHAEALQFDRFILLDRQNRLRKIVSSLIGHQKSETFHLDQKEAATRKQVSIDPQKIEIDYDSKPLIRYLEEYDEAFHSMRAHLSGKKVLELSYEADIQDDPTVAYRKVCDFLGVEPVDVYITRTKTNPYPLSDLITNFDEVKAVLKHTRYEWMLE